MSTFDPKALEDAVIDAPNATTMTPIPPNTYPGICADVEIRTAKTKDGDRAILRLKWDLLDDDLKTKLGRDRILVDQDIWLDLNEDGSIATGPDQNVRLGRTREACDLNDMKGFTFNMFKDQGPLQCTVIEDPDEKSGDIYSKVVRVSKEDAEAA